MEMGDGRWEMEDGKLCNFVTMQPCNGLIPIPAFEEAGDRELEAGQEPFAI